MANSEGDLVVELRTVDWFHNTVNKHEACFCIVNCEEAIGKIFIEPSQLDIMVMDGVSEMVGVDELDGSLVIFKE